MVQRLNRFFRHLRAARAFGLGWLDAIASAAQADHGKAQVDNPPVDSPQSDGPESVRHVTLD